MAGENVSNKGQETTVAPGGDSQLDELLQDAKNILSKFLTPTQRDDLLAQLEEKNSAIRAQTEQLIIEKGKILTSDYYELEKLGLLKGKVDTEGVAVEGDEGRNFTARQLEELDQEIDRAEATLESGDYSAEGAEEVVNVKGLLELERDEINQIIGTRQSEAIKELVKKFKGDKAPLVAEARALLEDPVIKKAFRGGVLSEHRRNKILKDEENLKAFRSVDRSLKPVQTRQAKVINRIGDLTGVPNLQWQIEEIVRQELSEEETNQKLEKLAQVVLTGFIERNKNGRIPPQQLRKSGQADFKPESQNLNPPEFVKATYHEHRKALGDATNRDRLAAMAEAGHKKAARILYGARDETGRVVEGMDLPIVDATDRFLHLAVGPAGEGESPKLQNMIWEAKSNETDDKKQQGSPEASSGQRRGGRRDVYEATVSAQNVSEPEPERLTKLEAIEAVARQVSWTKDLRDQATGLLKQGGAYVVQAPLRERIGGESKIIGYEPVVVLLEQIEDSDGEKLIRIKAVASRTKSVRRELLPPGVKTSNLDLSGFPEWLQKQLRPYKKDLSREVSAS